MKWCRPAAIALAVVSVSAFAACKTATYVPLQITVPPGLTMEQIESSLIAGLAGYSIPPGLDSEQLEPDALFKDLYGPSFHGRKQAARWTPEHRESGVVYAGYEWRSHYIRVALNYDTQHVMIELADSRNLGQQGNNIHKNAVLRVRTLSDQLAAALGQMTAYRGVGQLPPVAAPPK